MTYKLFIGDRTFSSWSMRGWLMLEHFPIPHRTQMLGLYDGTLQQDLADLAPARTVPVLQTQDGHVVGDSLAIAETLVEAHPDLPLYPSDPAARVMARNLMAEMHSGFSALRGDCPMNLRNRWDGFQASDAVLADVARIEKLWALARNMRNGDGPWLFGDYSFVDAFYAPVAARIVTYGLPRNDAAQAYIDATLSDPIFRQWRAMGETKTYDPFPYASDLTDLGWPMERLNARPVEQGVAENDACPYSGDPVTHLMELDGRIFGFCNAFCRDKTVADPAAWPKFMALYQR
ncbi:glutathione S-transferase [Yoonia sp. 208BN28-4]|uniref:glutathione S-transferase n=1 Tax=Yoonia sp. 208BN28-4 TaxID=3126505 RepID=UPI0030B17E0F